MDARRKRLLYRATHCGMTENDVLLGKFALARIGEMGEDEEDPVCYINMTLRKILSV